MIALFGDEVREHHVTIEGEYNQALPIFAAIESEMKDIQPYLSWDTMGAYYPADGTVHIKVTQGPQVFEDVLLDIDDHLSARAVLNRLIVLEKYLDQAEKNENEANIKILSLLN